MVYILNDVFFYFKYYPTRQASSDSYFIWNFAKSICPPPQTMITKYTHNIYYHFLLYSTKQEISKSV